MPVNLSVKNVPDDLAERLRKRATLAHRSLQGELMAILEEAVTSRERLNPAEALARLRAMGLRTADESTAMIRADRRAR